MSKAFKASKALWIGGVVVLIGGGYFAGIVMTGKQVDEQFNIYLQSMQEQAKGDIQVTSSVNSSMFTSSNSISIEFLNMPEKVVDWAGSKTLKFDVNYSHGFLKSTSVMTLAESEFLEKLKSHQKNTSIRPLEIISNYSYGIGSGEVVVEGEIATDAFIADLDLGTLNVGSSEGSYRLSSDALAVDWKNNPVSLLADGLKLNIGEIKLKQQSEALNGDLLSAKLNQNGMGKISIESVDVEFYGVVANLDDFLIDVEQKVESDRVLMNIVYSAESFKFKDGINDLQFDKPTLDLGVDLDLLSLEALVNSIRPLQQKAEQGIDVTQEGLALLNGVTQKGISASINRLEVASNGAKAEGKAVLSIAPFSIEEAKLDREAFLKKADLTANVTLPKKLLESLPNYDPSQINFFVGMGFLTDDGDNLELELIVDDGVVKLNDKVMPGF